MTTLFRIVLLLCILSLFVFGAKAQGFPPLGEEVPNGINCQKVGEDYQCEIVFLQTYSDGQALQIANKVAAKKDTEIVFGSDSLFVKYTGDKTYQVWGYGSGSGTTQVLAETKSVKDIRLELVVLINGLRVED